MRAKKMVFNTSLVLCALGCAQEPEPESRARSVAAFSRVQEPARPCRSDQFYVDFPVWSALPEGYTDTSFLPAFTTSLTADANAQNKKWFCGSGQVFCPRGSVTVDARSLLPERSTPSWRADGHLRHFRVRFFSSGASPRQLVVRDDQRCVAVAKIRSLFEAASGISASDMLLVGRECDASVSGVEGAPDLDMLSWHLGRIGLPTSALTVQPPTTTSVDLALVDSGIIAPVQASIGVASEDDLVGTPGNHVHGTALAILSRQVAPDAAIRSVRVLDAGGSGTSGAIALGLDRLIFDTTSTDPLVINLSLGWPAELGHASGLVGANGCATNEEAFGEAVRYVLDVARRIDALGTRPIFVTAAAGNLPLPANPGLYPTLATYATGPGVDLSPAPSGASLFFPAEWNRVDTFEPHTTRSMRLAVAVSATDDRNRRAQVSIPDAETPIAAPGQHVYASDSSPGVVPTSEAMVCGGAQMMFPPTVTLPVALTGTSVSAALVSAAAARAQAARIALGAAPLKRTALARLIYLTGRPACRNTSNGTAVRMLDVARLDAAIASCPSLVSCASVVVPGDDTVIEPNLLGHCSADLAACTVLGATQACPSPTPTAVDWPGAYLDVRDQCSDDAVTEPFQSVASCQPACPFNSGRARSAVGSLGPQPGSPACPDCPALFDAQAPSVTLYLELEGTFEPGTTITKPYLVLSGPHSSTGAVEKVYVDLAKQVAAPKWVPGAHLDVSVPLSGVQIAWTNLDAVEALLVVGLTPPGGKETTDVSPLRVGPL